MNRTATITPADLTATLDAVDGVLHVINGVEVYAGTSIPGGAYMTFLVDNLSAGQDEMKMSADEVRLWVGGVGGDLTVAAEALTASLS